MANLSHLPHQWRDSGLTQRAFCEREGVSLATFSFWRAKELKRQLPVDVPVTSPRAAFSEVLVEASSLSDVAIEITYPNGTHVRIPLPQC